MTTEELVANLSAGQEFVYFLSNGDKQGKRIVEVDRHLSSITLLKVEDIDGYPEAHWESSVVFAEWVMLCGAKLR